MLPSNWPQWYLIPIALVLTVVIIGLGLVLEPAVQAVTPHAEPTPTLSPLPYSAPISDGCVNCHTSEDALQSAGADDVQAVLIESDEVHSLHGRLGCVTCHAGNGETDDKDAAHEGLIVNPSDYEHADRICLVCHESVRNDVPEHHVHTPHARILQGVHEKIEVCSCSNCHGPVAHGVAPVGSHKELGDYCIHCHEDRDVPQERLKCAGCHIGPHDVTLDCETCHISTETWGKTELSVHPMELNGRHKELHCFECHTWPNFGDLTGYTCVNCHTPPHELRSEQCASCDLCHTDGGDWGEIDESRFDHTRIWPYHVGVHKTVACRGCHLVGYEDMSPDCGSCHTPDPDTCTEGQTCTDCHLSDIAWSDVRQ